MARSSTTFQKGDNEITRKGVPNRLTNDQRDIFDSAISPDQRVQMVKAAYVRAMSSDDHASGYMKMLFDFVFSKPRQGHDVSVLDLNEVLTTEVCEAAWIEIIKEARERDARSKTPILGIIEAEVIETVKGNGRRNGPTRNVPKKKAKANGRKNSKARKG